jgi:hypothetical protein
MSLYIQRCENVKSNKVLCFVFVCAVIPNFSTPINICRVAFEMSVGRHDIVHEISIRVSWFCSKIKCFANFLKTSGHQVL